MSTPDQRTPAFDADAANRRADAQRISWSDSESPGLLTMSRIMQTSSPVFIVGEARSGSSILFRTLLMQPTFRPKEENLQETSFISQAPSAGGFDQVWPRNLRRFMLEDEAQWAQFLDSLRPLRLWLQMAERMGPGFGARWLLAPSKLVARSYLFHAQRARGCERMLEKTPNHIDHIPRLLACFPQAYILYVHRHPVDVYSSYVRRGIVDPKAEWARISPDEFCNLYRHRTRRAIRAEQRRPDTVRLIRYGDFTARPETELSALADFLKAEFDPSSLTQLDDPQQWAHWERSRHLYEGIKTHTKDWREYLDPVDAHRIQNQLEPEMAELGHDRYHVWSLL